MLKIINKNPYQDFFVYFLLWLYEQALEQLARYAKVASLGAINNIYKGLIQ